MYKSILVGTDGSETANRAVLVAGELAAEQHATLHIACAYSHPERGPQPPIGQPTATNLVLDEAKKAVAALGVHAQTHLLSAEPAAGLLEAAQELGCDLIVVGNRGLGGVEGYFLGSVPAKVVREAPCSVTVVKTT